MLAVAVEAVIPQLACQAQEEQAAVVRVGRLF
jgi:hypothetical protein